MARKGTVVSDSRRRPTARAAARAGSFPLLTTAGIAFLVIDETKLHILHNLIGKDSAGVALLVFLALVVYWSVRFLRWSHRNDL